MKPKKKTLEGNQKFWNETKIQILEGKQIFWKENKNFRRKRKCLEGNQKFWEENKIKFWEENKIKFWKETKKFGKQILTPLGHRTNGFPFYNSNIYNLTGIMIYRSSIKYNHSS